MIQLQLQNHVECIIETMEVRTVHLASHFSCYIKLSLADLSISPHYGCPSVE